MKFALVLLAALLATVAAFGKNPKDLDKIKEIPGIELVIPNIEGMKSWSELEEVMPALKMLTNTDHITRMIQMMIKTASGKK